MRTTMPRTSKRPARRVTSKRPAPRRVPSAVVFVSPDAINAYLRSQRQSIAQIDDYGGDYPVCVRSGFSAAYASSIRSVDVEYFVKGEQGRPTEAQKAAKRDHIKLAARLLRSAGLAPKVSASGYRVSVKAGAR